MPSEEKELKGIEDLTPDPDNANLGTERGQYMLEESISTVGAGRSIVADRGGVVLAGNKTLESATEAGLDIEVVKTDGNTLVVVQRTDLDVDGEGAEAERARQLAYFDNRASEVNLDWDPEKLVEDLKGGVELEKMFHPDELRAILDQLPDYENTELVEFEEEIKPMEYFRVLISVPVDQALDVREVCETLEENPDVEVMYGAN